MALVNGFSWYVLPKQIEKIFINCKYPNFIIKNFFVKIEGPTLFDLDSNCIGTSENHIFLPKSHGNESQIIDYKMNFTFSQTEINILNNTEIKISTINSTIIETSDILKIVSTEIVTPENFMYGLKMISEKTIHDEILFPFENYHTYITLSNVNIYFSKTRLVYVLETPIPINTK